MKAYKLEVLVIDHENMGMDEIIREIENAKYSCPQVKGVYTVDIGQWEDDHPLNKGATCQQTYLELDWEKIK